MGILLVSTSDKLQVISDSAIDGLKIQASYVDYSGSTVTPGRTNTNLVTASTADVVPAPGSGVYRNVTRLSIWNNTAANAITATVQHTNGTTVCVLYNILLNAQTLLTYEGGIFFIVNALGVRQESANAGQLLGLTLLAVAGSATSLPYLTGPNTTQLRVRVQGGGGAGGGGATATSSGSAGGGGGAGGYAEKWWNSLAPLTSATFVVGAGGTAGATGANGNNGGDSSFTLSGLTVTAFGGNGGIGSAASASGVALGGARGTTPTFGDINVPGEGGSAGYTISAAVVMPGAGGSGRLGFGPGNGRITQGSGSTATATSYGSGGGGGAVVSNGGAVAGAAGIRGAIIVEEYS